LAVDEMIAWFGMTIGMRVQHRFRVGWRYEVTAHCR
jgi:hypothetical protein